MSRGSLPPDLQVLIDREALDNLVDPLNRDKMIVNVRYVADIPELTLGVVNTMTDQASKILGFCEREIRSLVLGHRGPANRSLGAPRAMLGWSECGREFVVD